MENTITNKAKFFAQYWGQKILTSNLYQGIVKVESFFLHKDNILTEDFLILKPLSSITDEDVLKIAELLSWRRTMQESSIISQTKDLLLNQSQTNLYREHWSDIVDKVRELGYAHKWNDANIEKQIKYGWIKLED